MSCCETNANTCVCFFEGKKNKKTAFVAEQKVVSRMVKYNIKFSHRQIAEWQVPDNCRQ